MLIVFAGSPGVGKSFFLNSLIGETVFKTGVGNSEGHTQVLERFETGNRTYFEIVGPRDFKALEKTAQEVSSPLTIEGNLKLIFVCTLEAGQIRPSDFASMKMVIDAIEDAGVDVSNKYSVIINKCNPCAMKDLNAGDGNGNLELLNLLCSHKPLKHIGYLSLGPLAENKFEWLLENNSDYAKFVEDAPMLQIPAGTIINRDIASFHPTNKELESELREMKAKFLRLQRKVDRYDHWIAITNPFLYLFYRMLF